VGPGEERDPGALVAHLQANAPDKPRDAAGAHAHAGGMAGPLSQRNGHCAEDLAALYLAARGLELLARNVRCKAGEIDLVCREGATLVVIEVRQRARSEFGGALASVGRLKRRKLIRAARFLLQTRPAWRRCIVRFDVIGVQGDPCGVHEIAWIKDAFRAT
jgi:putative endonuclease